MNSFLLILFTMIGIPEEAMARPRSYSNHKLLSEWRAIDNKIQAISSREAELSNEKLRLELALNETTENIKSLTLIVEKKRSFVLSRMRYLNQESGADLLRHLIESTNPGELDRNFRIYTISYRMDLDMVRQYNRELIKLERERQTHSLRIAKLNELQRELKLQTERFHLEMKQKSELLTKIRHRLKSSARTWIQELEKALQKRDSLKANLYRSLLNQNFLDRKGQLTSPTDGNIRYRFGALKLDSFSPALPFHGVFFDSPAGTAVRAVADGSIVWIGEINGLGTTVILDHGRGIHSVYSRLQLANKKIGEMIKEGANLGKIAEEKDRFGEGLYFEIREGRLAADPTRWILTKSELFSKEMNQWENVQ